MRKTYMTRVQDRAGSFLEAARVISARGGNIVRTSYNRSVDSRTMFLDVQADDPAVFDAITSDMEGLGYLSGNTDDRVILISLTLRDVPGSVIPVLEILKRHGVNISYMNAQDNGTPYQHFKMGIYVEDPAVTKRVLDDIAAVCEVTILDYEITDKVLDSTVFYITFANEMRHLLSLNDAQTNEFILNSNRVMQLLDDRNELPFKTFDYVRRFATEVQTHMGSGFRPEYFVRAIGNGLRLHLLEPPCGSSIHVLESDDELMFVDGGFSCFAEQTFGFLSEKMDLSKRKVLVLTHSDIDHTGIAPYFDRILCSSTTMDCFTSEEEGGHPFRERNPKHAPYYRLSRIIAGHVPPESRFVEPLGRRSEEDADMVYGRINGFDACGVHFDAYEGNGGHVWGDTVYACPELGLAFTGDDLVNIKDISKEQYEFNMLAPYLMQSVNMDSQKARECRRTVSEMFRGYLICPGHGEWMRL